jgi:hypothetical protein
MNDILRHQFVDLSLCHSRSHDETALLLMVVAAWNRDAFGKTSKLV